MSGLDAGFKSYILSRCQDRSNPMTLSEAQNFLAKFSLLNILSNHEKNDIAKVSTEFLLKKSTFIGHNYVSDVLNLLSETDLKGKFQNIVSFSIGSWSQCSNGHLFSSAMIWSCPSCQADSQI
jgi:hypothetical protein